MDDDPGGGGGHQRGLLRPLRPVVRAVHESEKVLMEASEHIGEVQRYLEALYAKRPVNLPAFERLVLAHILGEYRMNGGWYKTIPCRTSRMP